MRMRSIRTSTLLEKYFYSHYSSTILTEKVYGVLFQNFYSFYLKQIKHAEEK